MKKTAIHILLCLAFSMVGNLVFAQNINTLKKQQKQSKEKIELTNKLLQETQTDRKNTVTNLSLLKRQISEREKLIHSINAEIGALNTEQARLDSQQTALAQRLDKLKTEYAKLMYHAYFFKKQHNKFLYIFSAESVSQAYRRLRYVQQYSEHRKQQALEIQSVADELVAMRSKLEATRGEKQMALKNKEVEANKLQSTKNDTQKMLSELSKKEKDLARQLEIEQKKSAELNRKIDELIAKEIAEQERQARLKREREEKARQAKAAAETVKAEAARKAAEKKATAAGKPKPSAPTVPAKPTVAKPDTDFSLSKEESLIAGNFEKNKGRLPYPAKGVITGHFGLQQHAVLNHVQVNNKGIYIQTEPNADACAVFDGEVTQVFAIPGSNNAVIVKHGNFRTVYSNLTTTYVKVGSKVNTRQKIGKVFVDSESDNKTELYFMVYRGSALENPENWLSR